VAVNVAADSPICFGRIAEMDAALRCLPERVVRSGKNAGVSAIHNKHRTEGSNI